LIRGVNVSRALNILKFTDKRAADPIAKTLRSAIANATYLAEQQNIAIDPDDLWVKTCFVDMGVHKNRRRMRPAPQGRAYKEQRHYCHITILVSSEEPPQKDIKESKKGKEGDKSSGEKPKSNAKTSASLEAIKSNAEVAKLTEVKENKKVSAEPAEEIKIVDPVAAAAGTGESVAEQAEEQHIHIESEVADVKNVESQTTAEKNETKPADEAQLDKNEELERQ